MANPEKRSIVNRLTRGRFGRRGQPAEVAQVSPARPQLSPEVRAARINLAAVLNAYDLATPDEKARMRAEMQETGDTTLPRETVRRGRAAAEISDVLGADRQEGIRNLEALEDASRELPGLQNLISFLAEDKKEEQK